MVIIITGAGHTGKTLLAQRLLETYKFPYLSIDHLKMGLIRSKNTELTPLSDTQALTQYLWPVVAEMIKTAIENEQNLIVEGCYIPESWEDAFSAEYLESIRLICLVMTREYIEKHMDDILKYADVIEKRLPCEPDKQWLISENEYFGRIARKGNCKAVFIDKNNYSDYFLFVDEIS